MMNIEIFNINRTYLITTIKIRDGFGRIAVCLNQYQNWKNKNCHNIGSIWAKAQL